MFSLIVAFLISMSVNMTANQSSTTTTPPPSSDSSTTPPPSDSNTTKQKKPAKSDPSFNTTGGTGHWAEG